MNEIYLCENNVSNGLDGLIERIEQELTDVQVILEPCLGQCGTCFTNFFAVYDGDTLEGNTPEELFDAIKKAVVA